MKTKHKHPKQDRRKGDDRHLTLMAVQEKLGLFKQAEEQVKPDHDYLKTKPLGLI